MNLAAAIHENKAHRVQIIHRKMNGDCVDGHIFEIGELYNLPSYSKRLIFGQFRLAKKSERDIMLEFIAEIKKASLSCVYVDDQRIRKAVVIFDNEMDAL